MGCGNSCMANIYQCTKYDENIFIYDWDLEFLKSAIWSPSDPYGEYFWKPNLV